MEAEEQRERILRAASRVLAEHGFDGVRLRGIAKAAGVSIGMLQHYFETREHLLKQAAVWGSDDILRRLSAARLALGLTPGQAADQPGAPGTGGGLARPSA